MYHNRLNKRDLEYVALEDEFRMGLQIEANRFREVSTAKSDLDFHGYHFSSQQSLIPNCPSNANLSFFRTE